jgi:hypothetical protein
VVLAIGLVILWIAGLNAHAAGWLTWLDGVAAVCAFLIAGSVASSLGRGSTSGFLVALAVGLAILWIIGLATHAALWLTWWTFGFACAFLLLGIGAGVRAGHEVRPTQPRTV